MVKTSEHKEIYVFDNFRLDVYERLLSREGERVPLPEKAFETLCALVRRDNRLASKEDLLNEIWADATVEENNLDKNISLLRRVLGEPRAGGKFIETVRGHGFRFVPSKLRRQGSFGLRKRRLTGCWTGAAEESFGCFYQCVGRPGQQGR